jgi:hypothetical protein
VVRLAKQQIQTRSRLQIKFVIRGFFRLQESGFQDLPQDIARSYACEIRIEQFGRDGGLGPSRDRQSDDDLRGRRCPEPSQVTPDAATSTSSTSKGLPTDLLQSVF